MILSILALGTVTAALLAVAVELLHRQPRPKRVGFEVRYEHRPEERQKP